MATEVEEIARSGKDDGEDDGEDMKSYDDVESSAFSDMKKEIGEEGANAVRDYVKACIQKATEEDEADEE